MKLLNAFSLQMLSVEEETVVKVKPVSVNLAKELFAKNGGLESAVGHADTANVLADMFKMPVPFQRSNVKLDKGEMAVVAQVVGGRLPEGATTLPEGFKMVLLLVEIK